MKTKLGLWPVAASLVITLVVFALFPPFFGFMDDLNYVRIAEAISADGFLQFMTRYLPADYLGSGRLRPFLPLMAWVFYGPFDASHLPLHMVNGIFNLLLLAVLAWAYFRAWRLIFPERKPELAAFVAVFFTLELFFPWSHLLVSLPALQEKIIFSAAAAAIFCFSSERFFANSVVWRAPLLIALIALGSFTRESFILFYPTLLALSWAQERKSGRLPAETLFYLASMIALLGLIWWLGRGNPYKGKFGIETLQHTLKNSRSIWLFAGLALASLACSLPRMRGRFIDAIPGIFPSLGLLGFVMLMIPWGVGGYLNTVAAPLFAAAAISLAPLVPAFFSRGWIRHGLIAFVLAVFTAELVLDATTKRDLKLAMESEQMRSIAAAGQTLYAPCDEGAHHLRHYAPLFFGYELKAYLPPTLAEVRQLSPGTPTYWFVGKHLSCWPGDFDPYALVRDGKAEVLWEGTHRWSHRILKIR